MKLKGVLRSQAWLVGTHKGLYTFLLGGMSTKNNEFPIRNKRK